MKFVYTFLYVLRICYTYAYRQYTICVHTKNVYFVYFRAITISKQFRRVAFVLGKVGIASKKKIKMLRKSFSAS